MIGKVQEHHLLFLCDLVLISRSVCVTPVAEMVQLEQTSPSHRTSSRDSDDPGEATPTHVRVD